jgi:hypothetical protein
LVAGAALEAAITVAMNDDNNHLVNDPGKTHPPAKLEGRP